MQGCRFRCVQGRYRYRWSVESALVPEKVGSVKCATVSISISLDAHAPDFMLLHVRLDQG